MPHASGAFGQLRYIVEATPGVTPGSGNGVNLRSTGNSLKATVSTTESAEISAVRMARGLTRTDVNVDGGFNFELSGKEYDPFLEGLMRTAYTHYGTNGLGTTFSLTTAAGSITAAVAPTSTSAFTNLAAGSWIKVVPPVGASQTVKDYFADAWFKVGSTTSTVITLDASTQISGAGLGITAVAGYAISQSITANTGSLTRAFTMEYAMTDINQFLAYRGMQVNGFNLDMQVGSIISGDFSFIGMAHGGMVSATTLPGSPVASQTLDPINAVSDIGTLYEGSTNLLGSGGFVKSVKLSVTNNLRAQKALGVLGSTGVGVGNFVVTGNIEMYVDDAAYYTKWYSGVNTSLTVGCADAYGNGYLFEMDKINFTDGGLNPGGQSDDAMLSLPFTAIYDATKGRGLRITRAVAA